MYTHAYIRTHMHIYIQAHAQTGSSEFLCYSCFVLIKDWGLGLELGIYTGYSGSRMKTGDSGAGSGTVMEMETGDSGAGIGTGDGNGDWELGWGLGL